MARITLKINGDISNAEQQIKVLKEKLHELDGFAIKVSVDTSGIQALDKSVLKTAEAFAKVTNAQAKATKAEADLINARTRAAESARRHAKATQEEATETEKEASSAQKVAQAYELVIKNAGRLNVESQKLAQHLYQIYSNTQNVAESQALAARTTSALASNVTSLAAAYNELASAQSAASGNAGGASGAFQPTGLSTYVRYPRGIEQEVIYDVPNYANYENGGIVGIGGGIGTGGGSGGGTGGGGTNWTDASGGINNAAQAATNAGRAFDLMRAAASKAWNSFRQGDAVADLLGASLGRIMLKMAAWQVFGSIVAAALKPFRDAIAVMKEVDQQLTNIQKVSGATAEEINRIGDAAYATASKYGVAANEYLSAVYTFQKAGLGDSAEAMGELATKTMLVGDTTAEVASKFLIAVNAAWKLNGSYEALNKVVDEADYINNNYATDLAKLSAGMPIVASTAANMNMSIEETLAVLGTITSATQETGTKAATAWRALAMNITGELGTITDETGEVIEVTEESVKSMSDAMRIYGNEAVKAAQESGKVIDPMEAVISLAEAYKDGLLDDIELTNILMGVGGKLRTNQLIALVKDLSSETSTYYDIMSKLPEAAGTADAEIELMLGSWNAKTQILNNSITELLTHLIETDAVKTALETITGFINFLDSSVGRLTISVGALYAAVSLLMAHPIVAAIMGAIAAIGTINSAIQKHQQILEDTYPELYALKDAIDSTNESLKKTEDTYKNTEKTTIVTAETAKKYVDILEELESAGLDNVDAQNQYIATVAALNGMIPDLNLQIDAETGKINENTSELYDNIEAWKQLAIQKALQKQYEDLLSEQANLEISKKRAELELQGLRNKLEVEYGITGELEEQKRLLEELAEEETNKPDGNAKPYVDAINAIDQYERAIIDAETELEKIQVTIDELGNITISFANTQKKAADETDKVTNALGGEAGAAITVQKEIDSLEDKTKAVSAALKDFKEYGGLTTDAMNDLDAAIPSVVSGLFNEEGALTDAGKAAFETASQLTDTKAATEYLQAAARNFSLANAIVELERIKNSAFTASQQIIGMYRVLGGLGIDPRAVSASIARGESENLTDYLNKLATESTATMSSIASTYTKTSGGGGGSKGSSSSGSGKDEELERLKQTVADEKARYELMEKQGKSGQELAAQAVAVQEALHQQAEYMRAIGSDYADVAALSKEWFDWEEKRTKLDESYAKSVEALKSQLSFLEASGASDEDRVAKMRAIQDALHQQAEYLRSVKADEETIRKLSTEWWEWQNKILAIYKEQEDAAAKSAEEAEKRVKEAFKDYVSAMTDYLDAQRDKALKPLQDQLDALNEQKDAVKEQKDEQEKLLAVEKARAALENAQNERTVRQYNATSGQWEWVANAKTVDSARKSLEDAQKALDEYREEKEYQRRKKELEDQIASIKDAYDTQKKAWTDAAALVNSGAISVEEALRRGANGITTSFEDIKRALDTAKANLTSAQSEKSSVSASASYESGLGKNYYYDSDAGSRTDYSGADPTKYYDVHGNVTGTRETSTSSVKPFKQTIAEMLEKSAKYDSGGVLQGLGGIKATAEDELILPPDITKAVLKPGLTPTVAKSLDELGILTGARPVTSAAAIALRTGSSIGTQNNGDTFFINGIDVSEHVTRGTTIGQLAGLSRRLPQRYNS